MHVILQSMHSQQLGQSQRVLTVIPKQTHTHGFRSALIIPLRARQLQQDRTHSVFSIILENQLLFQKDQKYFLTKFSNLAEGRKDKK